MKELNGKARIYILTTILMGMLLFIWSVRRISQGQLWMILVLSALGSFSLIFKVEGTTNRSHYNISFLIYAFTFVLLGPDAAILVMTVSNLAEWIWYRYSWYIPSFNIFSHVIVFHLAGVIFHRLNPTLTQPGLWGVVNLIITLGFFTLANHLMVGLVIWLARGENLKQSGMFGFFSLSLDYILLCMGAGVASIWMFNPFAIIFALLPLYLIYTTLKVPALERQTETDPKTGVFNARYFEQAVDTELNRSNRFDRPLTVVMADLDLLRNINNTYGHLAGDEVLIGIARILKNETREYDVVARFGGEEFSILMPETKASDALLHVERLRSMIAAAEFSVPTSMTPIKATVSFGVAERQGFDQTYKDLIHNADAALYHSKLKGRNRAFVYSDEGYVNLFNHGEKTRPLTDFRNVQPDPMADSLPPPAHETRADPRQHGTEAPIPVQNGVKPVKLQAQFFSRLFFLGMVFSSLLLFIWIYQPGLPVNWIGLGAFSVLVVLTEWLSIDIYMRDTSISTSAAPLIGGFLFFGPLAAPVLSLALALVAMIKHRSKPNRFLFNFANQTLAGLLTIGFLQVTGMDFANLATWQQFTLSIIAACVVYLSTTWLISIGMGLEFHDSIKEIWVEKFRWLAPYYIGMGILAYALLYSYINGGLGGMLVVLVPLLILRLSQSQYIEKTKGVVDALRGKNLALQSSSGEIQKLNEGLLNTLAEVVDLRDPYVLGHSKQVARIAEMLATRLGLPPKQIELIRKAGLLHDIGKLGISEAILFKPGKLTPYEYNVVKGHVTLGADILETSHSLQNLIPIVRYHHEHYNGSGYPHALQGSQIPIEARILAVADAAEAMASDRPYRRGRDVNEILYEINRYSGTQFDPLVVKAFTDLARQHGESFIHNTAQKVEDIEDNTVLVAKPKAVFIS